MHSRATTDIALVRQQLGDALARGAGLLPRSVVWDAVMAGAAAGTGAAASPWIILFSDGLDNASWLAQDAVARTLASAGITVDFVRVPRVSTLDDQEPGRQQPGDLAFRTGGRVYSLTDRDLGRELEKRLRTRRAAPESATARAGYPTWVWHTILSTEERTSMPTKVNIVLDDDVKADLDRLVESGMRSRVVNRALRKEILAIRRQRASARLDEMRRTTRPVASSAVVAQIRRDRGR